MTRKEEALAALVTIRGVLARSEPTPLDRRLALTALDHAAEQIGLIEELKRPRRAKNGAAPATSEGATA